MLTITTEIENIKREITFALPYRICPYCAGEGCKTCTVNNVELRWVTRASWDHAPQDLKDGAERIMQKAGTLS